MSSQLHYRTCNLCEALCGLEIEHERGDIVAIRGDKADPLSRGHICPKAVALKDLHEDPDRLRQPVRRTADGWQPISWDEALDEVAQRLHKVQAQHGRQALAVYTGNPTVHNHGAMLTLLPLLKALGTRNRYSATSVDQLPHMLAAFKLFGHQLLMPVPDIDRCDYFLVFGANPIASNGSLMTAPDMRGRLKALRKRGGKLVVIDPRRTETAELADEHLFVRPGCDALVLLSMIHVVFAESLVAPGKVAPLLENLERLGDLVAAWTPERVAPLCGIDAATLRRLARELATTPRASCYCRVGTSTASHSGVAAWLVYVLNLITGKVDVEGGLMFPLPAMDMVSITALAGHRGGFDRYRSRVRALPEFGGEFPVTTLADEMLTPGEGQVRALLTHAGNPVLSCPGGERLDEALAGLDFMVSIDLYINETTRHADIILPPTGHLEHAQFDPVFHGLAVQNTIKFSPPLFAPAPDALHDWQIITGLIRRLDQLNGKPAWRARLTEAVMQRLGDRGIIDLALRLGPYGQGSVALRGRLAAIQGLPMIGKIVRRLIKAIPEGQDSGTQRLTLAKVSEQVHGLDLGALTPALPERLYTRGKRINLVPDIYVDALDAVGAPSVPDGAMLMIGRRHVRSNNSWMHNSQRLVKGKGRCDVMLHPQDACARGIGHGDQVRVSSEEGSVELPAHVTDSIMPGVVSVPHGWGHGRTGVRLSVAQQHAGVSVNDVISASQVETLTGMAVLNGVPVKIEKA